MTDPARKPPSHPPPPVSEKFAKAKAAQVAWAAADFKDRAECVHKFGTLLEKNADELAALMSAEMGKPVAHAKGEILNTIPRIQVRRY